MLTEKFLKFLTAILAAPIRMKDKTRRELSTTSGHRYGINNKLFFDSVTHSHPTIKSGSKFSCEEGRRLF